LHNYSTDCTQPPAFCPQFTMKMYNFPGCTILGNKLYKNSEFVRDLNAQDVQQLKQFIAENAEYQSNETAFNLENANNPEYQRAILMAGNVPVSFPGAPQPPSPPQFC
uniref:Pepsin-I3 domain-containing protein n=1 Tax=Anisakis simplex TaxID=6269 RepID=A0A0M3J5D8_ANISI